MGVLRVLSPAKGPSNLSIAASRVQYFRHDTEQPWSGASDRPEHLQSRSEGCMMHEPVGAVTIPPSVFFSAREVGLPVSQVSQRPADSREIRERGGDRYQVVEGMAGTPGPPGTHRRGPFLERPPATG